MKILEENDLTSIKGGTISGSISSAMINAFTNIIKVLFDSGHGVGSAIRRIVEGSLCPLE